MQQEGESRKWSRFQTAEIKAFVYLIDFFFTVVLTQFGPGKYKMYLCLRCKNVRIESKDTHQSITDSD